MKKGLLGYYDYTVILTYCGMLFAVTGIFCVLHGSFLPAAVFLMLAGVCDMFDGMVASTKCRTASEKCFGIQIDSLSDLISFGVFPGVFVYCLMDMTPAVGVISAVYVLCALIRLAYFNVTEEERQRITAECRKVYQGLPVTTIAVSLPALYILLNSGILHTKQYCVFLLVLSAVGFLTPFQLKKPKIVGKIVLVFVGILEMVGLFILMGVDPL